MMSTMNRRSTANIRRNGDSTEEMLRVSWYYYKMGMTQTEIAKRLNTNRVRVMKLLEGALEQGIVEIRIKDPRANLLQIETDLVQAFGLQDAIVIPTDSADVSLADLNEQLGMAAAQFLSTVFQDGDILAIGWGDSVSKTIKHLHLDHIKDFHLISLSGGMLPLLSDWSFFGKYLQHLKILPHAPRGVGYSDFRGADQRTGSEGNLPHVGTFHLCPRRYRYHQRRCHDA